MDFNSAIDVAMDRNLPFLCGVNALQGKVKSPINFSLMRSGVQFPTMI